MIAALNLIRTLTLNPFVGVQIGALLHTLWMLGLVIGLDELNKQDWFIQKRKIRFVLTGLKYFGIGLYITIAMLLLDISLWWFIGSWGYTDWWFQLPNAFLSGVIGLFYICYILGRRLTLWNILYLFLITVILELFLHWWVPQIPVMGLRLEDYFPTVIGIFILLGIIFQYLNQKATQLEKINPFIGPWADFTDKIPRKIGFLMHFILWMITVSQAILIYFGYSLFYWF
jgi:hypothetical protein